MRSQAKIPSARAAAAAVAAVVVAAAAAAQLAPPFGALVCIRRLGGSKRADQRQRRRRSTADFRLNTRQSGQTSRCFLPPCVRRLFLRVNAGGGRQRPSPPADLAPRHLGLHIWTIFTHFFTEISLPIDENSIAVFVLVCRL